MFIAIVPAYNEAKHIKRVIKELLPFVSEVVVVDDCSTDDTATRARACGATVLQHRVNRGQGAALETGHAYARAKAAQLVLHFDADGQFDSADILPAKQHLEEQGADILFGSRFLDTRSSIPWIKKWILLPLGKLFNRFHGAAALSDAHNGFRLLTAKALADIVITQDRMAHASEIPLLASQAGLKIVEFPVKVTYHEYGQTATQGITIVKDMLIGRFIR